MGSKGFYVGEEKRYASFSPAFASLSSTSPFLSSPLLSLLSHFTILSSLSPPYSRSSLTSLLSVLSHHLRFSLTALSSLLSLIFLCTGANNSEDGSATGSNNGFDKKGPVKGKTKQSWGKKKGKYSM